MSSTSRQSNGSTYLGRAKVKRPTLIFGAGTLARLAYLDAQEAGDTEIIGFVVDDSFHTADRFLGLPLYRWTDARERFDPSRVWFHTAIGYREMRRRAAAFEQLCAAGFDFVNIISPQCHVSRHATLGADNFLMAGTVIEAGVHMGSNNVVWSNATVCHDSAIGDHNFIAANSTLGGHVVVGDLNFLGFSCVVRERVHIGSETLVGAQALVLADTRAQSVYFGSPARWVRPVDPAVGILLT